jgi:hypothetical protein
LPTVLQRQCYRRILLDFWPSKIPFMEKSTNGG